MKGRFRIFSLKRLLLSIALGLLFLVSYVFVLFLIDQAGKIPPHMMLVVIGWPRPLWVLLEGQFSDANMIRGFTFFALCDTALYAVLIYPVLLAVSLVRHKRAALDPPPLPEPEQFDFGQASSN
jgi:hypothetical protein